MEKNGANFAEITIAIINYNGMEYIEECIKSFLEQDYEPKKVLMVDDGSSDGSVELVRKKFPEVTVIGMGSNTKNLNRVRNVAIKNSSSELIFLTDNDITIEKGCLKRLVACMKSDDRVVMCTPRLLFRNQPNKINTDGGRLHYLGTSVVYNRDKLLDECPDSVILKKTAGGGILLLRKHELEELSLFDDNFLMGWGDDGELYQRAQLAGYKCWHIPDAICFHNLKEWTSERHFRALAQVYNRWRMILITYSLRTALLCVPILVVFEILQMGFFFYKRIPMLYFNGTLNVLKNMKEILQTRKKVQITRKVPDSELLINGKIYLSPHLISNKVVSYLISFISFFFDTYWAVIKRVL